MEPILQTTQDERAQCLADMADTEYGKLKGYDVCFGFTRRLIVDAETAAILADDYAKQAAEIDRLRETLVGIANADWRKWEELASPEEFVRWAKSRANHALMPPNARGVSYEP